MHDDGLDRRGQCCASVALREPRPGAQFARSTGIGSSLVVWLQPGGREPAGRLSGSEPGLAGPQYGVRLRVARSRQRSSRAGSSGLETSCSLQAQKVLAQALGKADRHGIADRLRGLGGGAEEAVWIGEGLEGGRRAWQSGATLLQMAVAAIGDAVAAARQGGSGPVPVRVSVDRSVCPPLPPAGIGGKRAMGCLTVRDGCRAGPWSRAGSAGMQFRAVRGTSRPRFRKTPQRCVCGNP